VLTLSTQCGLRELDFKGAVMDGSTFAYHLGAWLSPGVITGAAEEIAHQPASASEIGSLRIFSGKFADAKSVAFDRLASDLLLNFHIPATHISISQQYRQNLPSEVWDVLLRTKFTGKISFECQGETINDFPVVAEVSAPVTEIRLIQWPLTVLADVVGDLATYWRSVQRRAGPRDVHHEHRAEWEFLTWIDLVVARAHGFSLVGRAGMADSRYNYDISAIGRFSSAHGAMPVKTETLSML